MKYTLSARARYDLLEIWSYVSEFNVKSADKLSADLRYTMQLIADFPQMGQIYDKSNHNLYCHSHGNYLILYKPVSGGIHINRVLHSARYIKKLL